MQAVAEVATLADYETVISFPPGSAGILLEPLVKVGNRAVGARVVGFAPALGEDPADRGQGWASRFVSSPSAPATTLGSLAAEHLSLGSVLVRIDEDDCKHLSFDRIMVSAV